MRSRNFTALLACLVALFLGAPARADDQAQQQKNATELQTATEAAEKAAIHGPRDVPVAGKATLHLPSGYMFVPQAEAAKFSQALGNSNTERLVGIVASESGSPWLAYLEYFDDGHVNDDDAKTWSADDMLNSLKEGTEAQNATRQERGFPPLEVKGWIEQPSYDAATHRLVWSALVKRKNDPAAAGSANYNTYALGREGHFELNLVTDASKIEDFKSDAKVLLASLDFDKGHRYADYEASTDRLAAYGLAALVGGVAAKKLGFIAVILAFLAKFAKVLGVAAIGIYAGAKRFLSGRGTPPAAPAEPQTANEPSRPGPGQDGAA